MDIFTLKFLIQYYTSTIKDYLQTHWILLNAAILQSRCLRIFRNVFAMLYPTRIHLSMQDILQCKAQPYF